MSRPPSSTGYKIITHKDEAKRHPLFLFWKAKKVCGHEEVLPGVACHNPPTHPHYGHTLITAGVDKGAFLHFSFLTGMYLEIY